MSLQVMKYTLFNLVSIVLTAIVLMGIYLFLGKLSGNIVLIASLIGLATAFYFSFIALLTGETKFFKWKGKVKQYFILSYILVAGMLLITIWMFNFVINTEVGKLSAADKVSLLLREPDVNDEVVNELTKDYLVLSHQNITFTYPPDAEKDLHRIISNMDVLNQVEREVFGEDMQKSENLEVVVLPSFAEYIQAKPLAGEIEGGSYNRANKRALIYQQQELYDDASFLTGIFSHEYGHYLMDIFLAKQGIGFEDVPVWYHEGISEYISFQETGDIRSFGNVDTELKFSNLQTHAQWDASKNHSDVYSLARKAIDYVVRSQNDTKILTDILLHQKETGSFKKSFEQLTGFKLATLNTEMYSVEEDLSRAYDAWQQSDFETAGKLYKEITLQHPRESLAWHQYALMLEEQSKWDEALIARRQVISINPQNAADYLYTSYLLTVLDTKEAVETAEIALELEKKNSTENPGFYQQWLEEISEYHNLISDKRYTEAYQAISQSEQLSYSPTIMEYLKDNRNGSLFIR